MPKAGELKTSPPNILIQGDGGCGKTSFILTAGPSLCLIDLDGNVRCGLNCGDGLDPLRHQAEIFEAHAEKDPFHATQQKLAELVKNPGPFRVVAIDGLTTLGMACRKKIVGDMSSQPSQPQWGSIIQDQLSLILQAKSAPFAFILVSHDAVEELDGTKELRLVSQPKSLGATLPRLFSDIWCFKPKALAGNQTMYQIHTKPFGPYKARSSGGLDSPLDAAKGIGPLLEKSGYPLKLA